MRITTMNYYFTGILIILMCLLALFVRPAHSGSTQSNTSGSNTAIEGGYTGGATTYESGSTSTTTSTNSSTSNIKSAPPTANAPSFSAQLARCMCNWCKCWSTDIWNRCIRW